MLAPVLGSVCVCLPAPPVPGQSWLGCAVCVFGCGFWLYPANPGSGWWCVCMGSGFAFTPPFLGGVVGCVRCVPVPRPSWLGCACLGTGFGCTRQSWLTFVVCAYGFGFRFHPANPGWVVRVCVFICTRLHLANPGLGLWYLCPVAGFAFTPPILAGAVGVCVWVRVLLSPSHSLLGCWAVCAVCLIFAIPGWDVRVWVRVLAAPRQSWLRFVVCFCGFWILLSPRQSWLGS